MLTANSLVAFSTDLSETVRHMDEVEKQLEDSVRTLAEARKVFIDFTNSLDGHLESCAVQINSIRTARTALVRAQTEQDNA